MIDLEELLHGEPTWDQVCDFWRAGEFFEEGYLVKAIRRHLYTAEQRLQLAQLDLSIEAMLNGRYGTKEELTVQSIYRHWNSRLGFKAFGS